MKRVHFLVACAVGAMALTASAESKPQQTSTGRIRVIAADDLFDKNVVASDGKDVGDIQYVLIRTDDAQLQHVVIESENENAAGQLVAIPFEAIQSQIAGDEIRLTMSMDEIKQAPHVTEDRLHTLTDPATIQKINGYWMPFSEAQGATAQEQTSTTVKTQAQVQAGAPAYLVLSETSYRVLQPGGAMAKDIEGMEVTSSDDKRLGDVEEIVIDLDSGRVAYTLVGRGGFLGLGMNYVAVPLQAIEFTDAKRLRLKVPMRQFNSMRGYLDDDVPRSVTREDLQRVYQQFDVKPYFTTKEEVARQ